MKPLFGRRIAVVLGATTLFFHLAYPAHSQELEDVLSMNLQQLMQMDVVVTSVSKRPQKIHETASAIYVVTQEDIRRSGAVNIMEALRLVPGVLVSKVNQNKYAISIRGFNRVIGSNKLLVMMDGRSVYSPLFSGALWIGIDTAMEDIDRIEVIRGPGTALWGSNAVAGVINIITKSANETQGTMVSGGSGTEENGFVTGRYGGRIGQSFNYRVYGKYRDRDRGEQPDDGDGFDGRETGQGGFRSDWQINPKDHLTMQGDYYYTETEQDFKSTFVSLDVGSQPFRGTLIQEGANFLSRWTRELSDSSGFKLQLYYDRLRRESIRPEKNIVQQVDLDAQYDFLWGDRQNISLGFNYRFADFEIEQTPTITDPPSINANLFGFFVHDEITIIPQRWNVIVGSKFEHNEFSGFEIQPNIRTLWTPNSHHSFWAAVSRAVRIPSVAEEGQNANRVLIPFIPPTNVLLRETNDGRTDAEELLAYEVGYRFQPQPKLSFDITAYLYDYDNIIDFVLEPFPGSPSPADPDLFIWGISNDNALKGEVYGVEVAGQWQPTKNWALSGSYTYSKIDLRAINPAVDPGAITEPEGEPRHIFNVRSLLTLPNHLEFDALYYYVSKNLELNVPSYDRLDLRLGWKPSKNFELSLVGQNLLDGSHPELREILEAETETERSFYAKATFRF